MVNLGLELSDDVDNSQTRVAQCDPIIYRTSKDHPEDHNPPEAGEDMPGSFELGVARACETKSSRKQSARRRNVAPWGKPQRSRGFRYGMTPGRHTV